MIMTDEEIRKSKEVLASLKEGREELEHIREELLEDPKVQDYVAASNLLRETNARIITLNQDIVYSEQENCQHPVWVLLNRDDDYWEGRVYFKCRCIVCGKEKTGRPFSFPKDRVIYDSSIMDLSEKWETFSKKFLDDNSSIEEKGKAFTKIFNSKRKH